MPTISGVEECSKTLAFQAVELFGVSTLKRLYASLFLSDPHDKAHAVVLFRSARKLE